jgi:hypothetical protein
MGKEATASDLSFTITTMISDENREFVNWLFDQLTTHTDTDMIDLHESDSCDDHLQLELLSHD